MLYNRVSTFEKPEHSKIFFSSSLFSFSPGPLSSLLFFSSFFLSFLPLLFSFLSLLRSEAALANQAMHPGARPNARRTRRGLASGPGATQADRWTPTQARSGQPRPDSPSPLRGQLVRELSRSRQPHFVNGFLVCTCQLVAAVIIVTHELSKVDSEVRSSRNRLSKI